MAGRLDRYVTKTVMGSYGATLTFVVFLWIVLDLLLNMSKYLAVAREKDLGLFELLGMWAQYHLFSLPWVFVLVAPFVSVIACMFAVARMMAANEIVPMVFTGRSMLRVLRPCLVMALVSGGIMVLTWEVLLPPLSRHMEQLAGTLEEGEGTTDLESIVLFSADRQRRLMVDRYIPEQERAEGVVMMDLGSRPEDLSEVTAAACLWNPEKADWELVGGKWRSGQHTENRDWLAMEGVTPRMLWLSGREAKTSSLLSYSELVDLIKLSPGRNDLVINLHYHLTWPIANLLLLLLALPFAVQFERGSKIGRIVLAILICGSYLVVDLTCQNLGRREYLHPVLAAWTPTILFGSLGTVMFGGIRT